MIKLNSSNKVILRGARVGLGNCCCDGCNWANWSPDPSTVCLGQEFEQQQVDLNGICPTNYRYVNGTFASNYTDWSPDPSTVCLGQEFEQYRSDLNGVCPDNYRYVNGIAVPNYANWSPDPSTVCLGQEFEQQQVDLNGICPTNYRYVNGTSIENCDPEGCGGFSLGDPNVFQISRELWFKIYNNTAIWQMNAAIDIYRRYCPGYVHPCSAQGVSRTFGSVSYAGISSTAFGSDSCSRGIPSSSLAYGGAWAQQTVYNVTPPSTCSSNTNSNNIYAGYNYTLKRINSDYLIKVEAFMYHAGGGYLRTEPQTGSQNRGDRSTVEFSIGTIENPLSTYQLTTIPAITLSQCGSPAVPDQSTVLGSVSIELAVN